MIIIFYSLRTRCKNIKSIYSIYFVFCLFFRYDGRSVYPLPSTNFDRLPAADVHFLKQLFLGTMRYLQR